MISIVHIPEGIARNIVECIYYNYSADFNITDITAPMLNPEIFFSFGSSFKIGEFLFSQKNCSHSAVFGHHHIAPTVQSKGEHKTMGILLKPWAINLLTFVDGRKIKSATIESKLFALGNLFSKQQSVFKELNAQDALLQLETLFTDKVVFAEQSPTFETIYKLVDNMALSEKNINHLVELSGVSAKTFIGVFKKNMQVSPLRFIHYKAILASTASLKYSNMPIVKIALDNGFYDQSHYNKIFKSFFKISPNAYRQMYQNG